MSGVLRARRMMEVRAKWDECLSTGDRISGVTRRRRRRHHSGHHAFDARAGNASDQSRPALKGNIVPAPIHGHRQTIAEADQEVDMGEAPQEPRW